MTDDDDDLDDGVDVAADSDGTAKRRARGSAFAAEGDMLLTKSHMAASEDGVNGTDMTGEVSEVQLVCPCRLPPAVLPSLTLRLLSFSLPQNAHHRKYLDLVRLANAKGPTLDTRTKGGMTARWKKLRPATSLMLAVMTRNKKESGEGHSVWISRIRPLTQQESAEKKHAKDMIDSVLAIVRCAGDRPRFRQTFVAGAQGDGNDVSAAIT